MSDAQWELFAVAMVTAVGVLVTGFVTSLVRRRARHRRIPHYVLLPVPDYPGEQYTVSTPAGPAVVTKVVEDSKGVAYEIHTRWHREQQVTYVAPSRLAVKRALQDLAADALGK